MKTYNEFLTELFDNPYPTRELSDDDIEKLDPSDDDYVRKFQTKNGETFFVHIDSRLNIGTFMNSDGRFGITGEKGPEAAKIISTVLSVGKEYLQKEKPPELEFSAAEKSRASLYKRIAQKYTPKEYTMKVAGRSGYTSFIMQRNNNLKEDYKGEHQAAGKEGAPLHDMTHNEVYPKDYYDRWTEYAGTKEERDAALVVNGYRNKPNRLVTIYRAVPHNQTKEERLDALEKAQAMWLRRNKVHPEFQKEYQKLGAKKYYEWLGDEEEKVKKSNDKVENIDSINPGDWVTIVRQYAKEHGRAHLKNKYKILSKKVKASQVWFDGNSLNEAGYSP